MPVYNTALYIERAVLSALNQTFSSFEILVVDDRGQDESMDIVRRLMRDHPCGNKIRIIEHAVNLGTGATKNTAIKQAQGEYLFFMDSDDEITSEAIEKLYNIALESDAEVVVGSIKIVDERQIRQKKYVGNALYTSREEISWAGFVEEKFMITTWNKLYRLDVLRVNSVDCPDHLIMEDPYFTGKLLMSVRRLRCTNEVTYCYYRNRTSHIGSSMEKGFTEKTGKDYIETFALYTGFYQQNLLSCPAVSSAVACGIMRFSVTFLLFMAASSRMTSKSRKMFAKECRQVISGVGGIKTALKGKFPFKYSFYIVLFSPYCMQYLYSRLFLTIKSRG